MHCTIISDISSMIYRFRKLDYEGYCSCTNKYDQINNMISFYCYEPMIVRSTYYFRSQKDNTD